MIKRLQVQIQGGIGNQMFTYASGYAFARELGVPLYLDLLSYELGYFRPYKLDEFMIAKDGVVRHPVSPSLWARIEARHPRVGIYEEKPYFWQSNQEKMKTIKSNACYYSGYWQCEKYFKKYEDDIRAFFQLKDARKLDIVESFEQKYVGTNTVAVHVRRGDFVTGGCAIDLSYYEKAINKIAQEVDRPQYVFFTDDREFVRDYFEIDTKENYHLFEDNRVDDVTELMCMTKCRHQISSNSSFAWWGAWLKPNCNGCIVVPVPQYLLGTDYYPDRWNKIRID